MRWLVLFILLPVCLKFEAKLRQYFSIDGGNEEKHLEGLAIPPVVPCVVHVAEAHIQFMGHLLVWHAGIHQGHDEFPFYLFDGSGRINGFVAKLV